MVASWSRIISRGERLGLRGRAGERGREREKSGEKKGRQGGGGEERENEERERDAGEMKTKVIEYKCVNEKYIRSSTTYMYL